MKLTKHILLCAALLATLSARADYTPTDANRQARSEFQGDKFGIFLHWGVYSLLGQGEWTMYYQTLNYYDYPHLGDLFNPASFDADAWVKAFADAGAKYITFTSRHHDGFSMWDTHADDLAAAYCITQTPYGQDIIKKLAAACEKYGVKLHLYYSLMDWWRPDYPIGKHGNPSSKPTDQQDYAHYFQFMEDQISELLTNYGSVRCLWFDGYWDHNTTATALDWRLPELYEYIHNINSACLVANNHHTTPFDGEDIQLFEQDLPGENTAGMSGGQTVSDALPLETCMTMNATWGWSSTDKNYKTNTQLIQALVKAAGKNANLLLNIGPKPDGTLPDEALARLQAIGDWLKVNGETIFGTRRGLVDPTDNLVSTTKGNKLYLHILSHDDTALTVAVPKARVQAAKMRATGADVQIQDAASTDSVKLVMPTVPDGIDTIVELTLTD